MEISNRQLFEIRHSKISLHHAKAGYDYPAIRLPFTFSKLAGLSTRIYQTVHDGALAFLVVVSSGGATTTERIAEISETPPYAPNPPSLHGGGRRFESGRAHRSFWDLEEAAVSIEFQDSWCKLCTSSEKLSTPPVKMVTPSLATLLLDFKIGELCSYTEARAIGLARKSVDWINRASKIF